MAAIELASRGAVVQAPGEATVAILTRKVIKVLEQKSVKIVVQKNFFFFITIVVIIMQR